MCILCATLTVFSSFPHTFFLFLVLPSCVVVWRVVWALLSCIDIFVIFCLIGTFFLTERKFAVLKEISPGAVCQIFTYVSKMVCTFLLVLVITVGIDSLRINGLLGRHCLSRPQPRSKLPMTVDDKVESSFYRDLALLSTKALDTVEDAVLHFRRTFLPSYQESATLEWMQNTAFKGRRHKARVVVVGSGWAAHAFLKICETDGYEVVCVSPRPYFVFTPMLASTAVGTVEYRSIVEPIRQGTFTYII